MTTAAENKENSKAQAEANTAQTKPTLAQLKYLRCGLEQPGGKLPLFDENGQRFKEQTIKACLSKGWCMPWYNNPLKTNWLVCKLTDTGRLVAGRS